MSGNYMKVATTPEVWAVIRASHPDLQVFSTYSNPDGNDGMSSQPQMMTEYGFLHCDEPIIGALTTWEKGEKSYDRANEKHEYWLCVPARCDECE